MALDKAMIAAAKVFTHHKPDVVESYALQRAAETAASKVEPADPHVRDEKTTVTARDGHQIPIRIFTPLDMDFSFKEGLKTMEDWEGTILFFHGGGWVTGQVDLYADACKAMARALKHRVVSVDYRLAPENRFPVPLDDCYDVARALFAGQILSNVVPDHVVIMGDSAGGNLAAATCLMARDTGDFDPKQAILIYPVLYNDYGPDSPYPSVHENGSDYLLTAQDMAEYLMLYSEHPEDYENPYMVPLLEKDLSGLPRTLIISAELCPLRDEDEHYAKKLRTAGNRSACYRMLGAMHGYLLRPMDAHIIGDTHKICRAFLERTDLEDPGYIQDIDAQLDAEAEARKEVTVVDGDGADDAGASEGMDITLNGRQKPKNAPMVKVRIKGASKSAARAEIRSKGREKARAKAKAREEARNKRIAAKKKEKEQGWLEILGIA